METKTIYQEVDSKLRQRIIEDWIRAFSDSPVATKDKEKNFDRLINQFGIDVIAKILDHFSTPERGNPGRLWNISNPFGMVYNSAKYKKYLSKKSFKYP